MENTNLCSFCGKPFWNTGASTFPDVCKCTMQIAPEKNNDGLTGWICPVCGCGLSPYTSRCYCQDKITSTCKGQ